MAPQSVPALHPRGGRSAPPTAPRPRAAGADAAPGRPERRRSAPPARRRPGGGGTSRPARRVGEPAGRRRCPHVAHPALHQRQRGLQAVQRGGLLRAWTPGRRCPRSAAAAWRSGRSGRPCASPPRSPPGPPGCRPRRPPPPAGHARAATARARTAAGGRPRAAPRTAAADRPPTSSPAPYAVRLAGTRAAVPAGPSGSPMSPAESTSPARVPRAWPSWPPNSAPPRAAIIDCIGPRVACASSGTSSFIAPTMRAATGSHSFFHTSRVW